MNFQDLRFVETADTYIDTAFKKSKKRVALFKQGNRDKNDIKRMKTVELIRIDTFSQSLIDNMQKIITSFPSIDNLDEFYLELIKCTIEYKDLKKSLGAVNWAGAQVQKFSTIFKRKIKMQKEEEHVKRVRREYLGRAASIIKQIKRSLIFLEEARKIMKSYPSIKSKLFTVCIAGFPNVGKSTLLSKMTTSTPEINAYPFTTKSLNVGYIEKNYRKIQMIDTPGTLNRFEKMNDIEKQAYLAIKIVANHIIYIFDPTEEYPMGDQLKLYSRVKKLWKEITVYISKTDMVENVDELKKRFDEVYTDPKELSKKLYKLNNKIKD